MKKNFSYATTMMMTLLLMSGCSSLIYTGTWKNTDYKTGKTFKTIFIAALTDNVSARQTVENDLARAVEEEGYKVIKSSDVFKPNFNKENATDEKTVLAKISSLGCDGILTAALIDQQSEDRYVPGSGTYAPFPMHSYYRGYWSYYSYRYPVIYNPGYYTSDKVYFFENNFYDVADGTILWSVQSKSVNPPKLDKFSKEYAGSLIEKLKKEGILK